jgi:phage terminase large subunit-like protein
MISFGQGFASMSAPTKELERLVLSKEVNHAGNQVLRWMASNVSIKQDPAGNMKPDKSKSTERIDGIVAALMALGRLMETDDERGGVYDAGLFNFI